MVHEGKVRELVKRVYGVDVWFKEELYVFARYINTQMEDVRQKEMDMVQQWCDQINPDSKLVVFKK